MIDYRPFSSRRKEIRMDVSILLAWLRLAGIECSCCSIDVFDGSGRGVVATKDISCGEVVVHVPDESVLMPENCSCSEVQPSIHKIWPSCRNFQAITDMGP